MRTKFILLITALCFLTCAKSLGISLQINTKKENLNLRQSGLGFNFSDEYINRISALKGAYFKIGNTWRNSSKEKHTSSISFKNISTINRPINSEVYVVNQELTSETKSLRYTVANPGNYQIGYAWVWVHGAGREVDLQVKVGNTVIKKFTATSEIAPYRFETRLEGLTAGQEVTVTATPKNGASYRLNYRLAYATPNFEGVGNFSVGSYGAVGDGVTNDYAAIKAALNAVKSAGGGVLTFDSSKTYYVEGPKNYVLFDFLSNSNINVKGNGAKIILHPYGNFISIDNSENIQIDGFTTTYSLLPYFQGKILDINIDALYLDMQVDAEYLAPKTGKYISKQDKFGRSFWVTVPNTKMGDGRHLSVDSTATIGNDPQAIRVFFKANETADLLFSKNQNAIDFIAPDIDFSHAVDYRNASYCSILRSSRIKISNIMTQSICHFGYSIGSNYGPITFSNTDILAPNDNAKHVSWRDGWHVWGNRYGIMIEDGDFDAGYMYDDVFSPHMNVPIVDNISGSTIRLKSKPGESIEKYTDSRLWLVGDLVSFWNEAQTVYYGMSRITNVTQGASKSFIDITLDSVLNINTQNTYAINEENLNRDMVIRNSSTAPKGRKTAVRQRTPILYQNCNFQNIHFWIYMGEPWRTRPRNIVFDKCILNERETFNVDDTWNLTLKNTKIIGQLDVSNCPSLILDNSVASSIKLRDSTISYIFGNGGNGNQNYDKDAGSIINQLKPKMYPSYEPSFLIKK